MALIKFPQNRDVLDDRTPNTFGRMWLGFLESVYRLFTDGPDVVSYTPTVTAYSGSITTMGAVSATYREIAGEVLVDFDIAITTNGTGAGSLIATVPFTIGTTTVGVAREINTTGNLCQIYAARTLGYISILTYSNTYPAADGYRFIGSIRYRKA